MNELSTAAGWLWENRRSVRTALQGVFSWIKGINSKDAREILIVGAGGVGKTTLARILSGEYDPWIDVPGEYVESLETESFELPGEIRVDVVVPPGQAHRRESTWRDLLGGIAAGRIRGLVLVGSNGYHTLGDIGYKAHRLYKEGMSADEFLAEYLAAAREEELQVLRRVMDYVKLSPAKMWVLSVIGKEDLWFGTREEVERTYRLGAYGDLVAAVVDAKNRSDFRHEFVFCSLLIRNFGTGRGEQLAVSTSGYDQSQQVKSVHRLFETVDALKKWESS